MTKNEIFVFIESLNCNIYKKNNKVSRKFLRYLEIFSRYLENISGYLEHFGGISRKIFRRFYVIFVSRAGAAALRQTDQGATLHCLPRQTDANNRRQQQIPRNSWRSEVPTRGPANGLLLLSCWRYFSFSEFSCRSHRQGNILGFVLLNSVPTHT